jgi:hypothetical protein
VLIVGFIVAMTAVEARRAASQDQGRNGPPDSRELAIFGPRVPLVVHIQSQTPRTIIRDYGYVAPQDQIVERIASLNGLPSAALDQNLGAGTLLIVPHPGSPDSGFAWIRCDVVNRAIGSWGTQRKLADALVTRLTLLAESCLPDRRLPVYTALFRSPGDSGRLWRARTGGDLTSIPEHATGLLEAALMDELDWFLTRVQDQSLEVGRKAKQ